MKSYFIFLIVAIILAISQLYSQVPKTITHQGFLTKPSGSPYDTTLSMTFKLYLDSTGGVALWTQSLGSVQVSKGVFNAILSPSGVAFDRQYWLEVEAGAQTLSPRRILTSSPYALRADTANNVGTLSSLRVSGNVGIGTPSPTRIIQTQTAINNYSYSQTNGTIELATYLNGFYNSGMIGTVSNHPFQIYTSNSGPVITFTTGGSSSGYVGIGTTSPSYPLHVQSTGSGTAWFQNLSNAGTATGMWGYAHGSGGTGHYGVYGYAYAATSNYGVYGYGGGGTNNYGGYFIGNVYVGGTLSKSAGSFKIDHPLDPENKYLIHSFVESPDMMNVYNGNITTGANGEAIINLPSYFQAENIDYKYQLTVIGQFAQAIVLKEIQNNQFVIKTDKPSVKVSWQVTGVRNDEYAKQHRIIPEVNKEGTERGKYLNPELYGKSIEMMINPPPSVKGEKKPE